MTMAAKPLWTTYRGPAGPLPCSSPRVAIARCPQAGAHDRTLGLVPPLVGFLLTGVLPLLAIVATIVWAARLIGRGGYREVPRRIWLVFFVEAVVLAALMIWGPR
jgi:hypothetical protein